MKDQSPFSSARLLAVLAVCASLLLGTFGQARSQAPSLRLADEQPTLAGNQDIDKGTYIVQFEGAPLATYQGGTSGLAATSPRVTGDPKLNMGSPAVQAYRVYLNSQQNQRLAAMESALGRDLTVTFRYDVAFNGLAAEMSAAEAARVAKVNGVRAVTRESIEYPLTDAGPEWIGAPSIWDGTQTGGLLGTRGEGMIVGILDTGINSDHPSFADIGGDGYNHANPLGEGNYLGACDPLNAGQYDPTFACNDKLIGAYSFVAEAVTPEDSDGHGSHTASTSAGNFVNATLIAPTTSRTRVISGVAPHANIIAYDVCIDSCPGAALLAAVNQAAADGVDVINYSISGGSTPYTDPVELAFLNATDAGVFVSTSAGNEGPGPATVAHRSPWVASVAAATHNRTYINALTNLSGGDSAAPGTMTGKGFTASYGPATLLYAGDFGNPLCLTAVWPAGTFSGEIVVCDRGVNGRVEKGQVVLAAGAGGMVLANDEPNGNSLSGDAHVLPAVHISYADGVALKAWMATGTGHMGTITGATESVSPANADITAGFSSRGPNTTFDVLKPDVTAPGVDIWAAVETTDPMAPPEYGFLSGTSMSSPHNAGAATLLSALHPTWSSSALKSALMTTADMTVLKEDGATAADAFDMGSGRIDLTQAARVGLIFDETVANYQAADPDMGGDPTTLNLASMMDSSCFLSCSWTRTATSVQEGAATWTASVVTDEGLDVTVSPAQWTLAAGASGSFTVDAAVSGTFDRWYFGTLMLSDGVAGTPDLHLPIAVYAASSTDDVLVQKTASDETAMPGDVVTYTITLANLEDVTRTLSLTDSLPADVTFVGTDSPGLTYDEGTHTLSWSGTLGPASIEIVESPSPFGYLPLASVGGTQFSCSSSCDETARNLNLGSFSYEFLGTNYNAVGAISNGYMVNGGVVSSAEIQFINQKLPDAALPNNVLAPLWSDLDLDGTSATDSGGGTWYFALLTDNDTDTRYLALEWTNAQQYTGTNSAPAYSFQIWIEENSSNIWFTYGQLDGPLDDPDQYSFTVGAENATGTVGDTWYFKGLRNDPGDPLPEVIGTPPTSATELKVNSVGTTVVLEYQVRINADATPGRKINVVEVVEDGSDESNFAAEDVLVSALSGNAFELSKTVGTSESGCAMDDAITVPSGTTVYYCYTITNTTSITLPIHTLDDSELGNIFTDLAYDLGPGMTVSTVDAGVVVSATLNETTVNTATWTVENGNFSASMMDTATVTIEDPTAVTVSRVESGSVNGLGRALLPLLGLAAVAAGLVLLRRRRAA